MRTRTGLIAIILLLGAGCTRGCSKPPEITADGKLVAPLQGLPGYEVVGDFLIGPYEGPPVVLYGPFPRGKTVQRLRVLNKIYQAVDDARVRVERESPSGDENKSVCEVEFMREGIYTVTCDYDEVGEWRATVHVEKGETKGRMDHRIRVYEPSR